MLKDILLIDDENKNIQVSHIRRWFKNKRFRS